MQLREEKANWLSGAGLQGGSVSLGCVCKCVRKRLSVLIKVQTDAVEWSKNSQKGLKTAGSIPPVTHTITLIDTHASCCSFIVNEPPVE